MSDGPRITGSLLKALQPFMVTPGAKLSGADIAKDTKLASGTLYPLLNRLEEAGWLSSEWEDLSPREAKRPRRRLYEMTGFGVRQARTAFRELQIASEIPAWNG